MLKTTLGLLTALVFLNCATAQMVLEVPENCFVDENYCYEVGVVYSDELHRKVIRVDFVARLDAAEFDSYQDVADIFLDFEGYKETLPQLEDFSSVKHALKDNKVVYVSSIEGDSEIVNGVEVLVHYSHNWTIAPWPLSKIEVIEKVYYEILEPYDGVDFSLRFFPDKSYPLNKGLKHKTGVLHIQYDEDEDCYNIYAQVDIIAAIDFLPTVAAPYVGKGFVAIFEGVFSDYL